MATQPPPASDASGRNADDVYIREILKGYPKEPSARRFTKTWALADFDFALDCVESCAPAVVLTLWIMLLRRLRDERLAEEIQARSDAITIARHDEAEKANERRHNALTKRLDDLKRPHWSVTPTFWITVISAAAAIAAAYFAWLAIDR